MNDEDDLDRYLDEEDYYDNLEAEASRKAERRIPKPKMKVDGMDSVRLIDYLQRRRLRAEND